MKYTSKGRLDIGRRVCNHKLTIRPTADFTIP